MSDLINYFENLLIGEDERAEIAATAKLIPDVPQKVKLIDMDKAIAIMKKYREKRNLGNTVIVKAIKIDLYKELSKSFVTINDRKHNVVYGILTGVDIYKNPSYLRVTLRDQMIYDLTDERMCQEWVMTRMHPMIAGSPLATRETAMYYVNDPQLEAKKRMNTMLIMKKAFENIDGLDTKGIVRLSRIMGVMVEDDDSDLIVRSKLLEEANKNPLIFNEIWTSTDRKLREILYSAVQNGIVVIRQEEGYFYKDLTMGLTEGDTIAKLQTDVMMLQSISKLLSENDYILNKVIENTKARGEKVVEEKKGNKTDNKQNLED